MEVSHFRTDAGGESLKSRSKSGINSKRLESLYLDAHRRSRDYQQIKEE